jgi:hypothetical protein
MLGRGLADRPKTLSSPEGGGNWNNLGDYTFLLEPFTDIQENLFVSRLPIPHNETRVRIRLHRLAKTNPETKRAREPRVSIKDAPHVLVGCHGAIGKVSGEHATVESPWRGAAQQ